MKKSKSGITVNIHSLIENLVIVAKDGDEAAEVIREKIAESLTRLINALS